jgi:(E)-4-hydroxy-3-methylbut-2-enyl-diphosphate synthase
MTKTDTADTDATLEQIGRLAGAGCRIIRCAVPNRRAARALGTICRESPIPVIADIHFDAHLALEAIAQGVAGIRINPGNVREDETFRRVVTECRDRGLKIRVGVNSGSIVPRDGLEVRQTPDDVAALMVRACRQYCEDMEELGFRDIVVSLKASDVPTTVRAYREMARLSDYPLHVGVTAAGPADVSIVKSAVGIGALLLDGIGDTIRVSLTGPPLREVEIGYEILAAIGLVEESMRGVDIISCPTCGRCRVNLPEIVENVRAALRDRPVPAGLTVAVMGCVVNGPGEAAEADVGIAAGAGGAFLFRRGKRVRKVPADGIVQALLDEIARTEETDAAAPSTEDVGA